MKTIEKLRKAQADAHVFYVKVHNYHWNIKGMQFFPIHEMTQKIYEAFSEVYDDCAERVIQLGAKPILTIKEIVEVAEIKEDSRDSFDAKYVLENIVSDYEYFMNSFKDIRELADAEGDNTTVAYADEMVTKFEKDIWMIKQTLA